MSEYRPTEYVVDFGDCRSNQFVRLNMALIEQNSAKLHERIARCRDCAHWATEARFTGMCIGKRFNPDGFCAWAKRKEDGDD